jgi:hypothetical protein
MVRSAHAKEIKLYINIIDGTNGTFIGNIGNITLACLMKCERYGSKGGLKKDEINV